MMGAGGWKSKCALGGEFQAEEIACAIALRTREALARRKCSDEVSAAGMQSARGKRCRKWLERPGLPGPRETR